MKTTREYSSEITKELSRTLAQISTGDAEKLVNLIMWSKKIFLAGAGRSGLMAKAFAMRLMHMGFVSFVVGETVTPNLEKDDMLLIGSGSGETGSLVSMANKAKQIGAKVALVSIFPRSTIGQMADVVVTISAPTPKVETTTDFKSIQPMGSLFEQSLLVFLDTIILCLMEKQGKDSNSMFTKHANLE